MVAGERDLDCGTSYDAAPPVLVFADRADGFADGRAAAEAAGGRVAAALPLDEAATRIRDQPDVAAIYLDVAEDAGAALSDVLGLLHEGASSGRCRSVVVLPLGLIDVAAAQAWHPDVALLSRADANDRAEAMRYALAPRSGALHDVTVVSPLQRLSKDASRIAHMLASLSTQNEAPPHWIQPLAPPDLLREIIRSRRLRDRHFPADLFADPAWDMLLALMLASLEKRRMTVTQLCESAAVPSTTALRWIGTMTQRGFLTRAEDPGHGRRIFIGLSTSGQQAMTNYINEMYRVGLTVVP